MDNGEIVDALNGEPVKPTPYESHIEEVAWYDDVAIAQVADTWEGTLIGLKFWIKPTNQFEFSFLDLLYGGNDDDDEDDTDDYPWKPIYPGGDTVFISGDDTGVTADETEDDEEYTEWQIIELDDGGT